MKYLIWYSSPYKKFDDIKDVFEAKSKLDAIKQFLTYHKGQYYVYRVQEIQN